ncbi:MAG: hypothetical protein DYH15_00085 [Nitrosomonas sp. PRO4]|nr:hypothetical protein [Nitrosomonas sp. PRO4]
MKSAQTDLGTLIASFFYLMSRYAHSQDKELILAIHNHLNLLEHHPDMQSETVRTPCRRLRNYWLRLLKKDTTALIANEHPDIPEMHANLMFLH